MASESESLANPSPVRIKRSSFQFEVDHPTTKDIPIEKHICFPTFTAGGYDWVLQYYPQGTNSENQGSHASLYLHLKSEAEDITAQCSFQVLDKTGKFVTICRSSVCTFGGYDTAWGCEKFIATDAIEILYCVKGIFRIACNIMVFTEPRVVESDLGGLCEHIEKLREKRERFDVTFEVEGENISAHRLILATRSPIFEAELFGPMAEAKMESIMIDEMKAVAFKALLHFVYTDQLAIDEFSDDKTPSNELLQELFVAADRYALGKLTLLCEEQLRKNLSVDTVVTTLHLADQHSRVGLKRKCLEFASDPENFSRVARTEKYLHIMAGSPSLFAELCEKIECSSHLAKKQRTD